MLIIIGLFNDNRNVLYLFIIIIGWIYILVKFCFDFRNKRKYGVKGKIVLIMDYFGDMGGKILEREIELSFFYY